jgi:hypothetical protein
MKTFLTLAALLAATALSACTSEQLYNTGKAWQQNQCAGIQDKPDYDRCLRNAGPSYDNYKRESGQDGK